MSVKIFLLRREVAVSTQLTKGLPETTLVVAIDLGKGRQPCLAGER